MNKNYIWGGLTLVAIAVVVWVFVANGAKTETPTENSGSLNSNTDGNSANQNTTPNQSNNQPTLSGDTVSNKVTISYDGTRFSPVPVTVKKGTTVAFVNNSSRGMWVGSDPHPQHTDLSSFDSRRAYSQGQIYEYTFNNVGTWEYHNHVSSGQRGVAIVE